jgi:hypothetical protein
MELVEDAFLGRVSSAARLVSWGASPLAAVLAGALTERLPARSVVAGSAAFALAGLVGAAGVHLLLRARSGASTGPDTQRDDTGGVP